jgi:hypothetical protein
LLEEEKNLFLDEEQKSTYIYSRIKKKVESIEETKNKMKKIIDVFCFGERLGAMPY